MLFLCWFGTYKNYLDRIFLQSALERQLLYTKECCWKGAAVVIETKRVGWAFSDIHKGDVYIPGDVRVLYHLYFA